MADNRTTDFYNNLNLGDMYRLEVLYLNLLTEPSEKGKYYDKRKML